MSTNYTYSLSTDFGNNLVPHKLRQDIINDVGISTTFTNITVNNDIVDITFANSLTAGEQTTLNTIVSNYNHLLPPQISLQTSGSFGKNMVINSLQTDNRTITIPDATGTLLTEDHAQTLINKTIDSDNNTIINIDNANIKANALIEASKIADGTISNTEFQYLNGTTANIQTQLDTHTHISSDINDFQTQVSNNADIKYNASYVTANMSITELLSGGVSWKNNLTYSVTPLKYTINGIYYSYDGGEITLDSSDPTNDRIDLIVATNTGTIDKVTGTPAPSPAKPDIDETQQIEITFVTVNSNQTSPTGITVTNIYKENVGTGGSEWDATETTGTARINLASTNTPYEGTKCIEVTGGQTNDEISLQPSEAYDLSNTTLIQLYIKSKGVWATNRLIRFRFYDSSVPNGVWATLRNDDYGFDSSNTAVYQIVSIYISKFKLTGSVATELKIQIRGNGTELGFYLDNILLQGGISKPEVSVGETNTGSNIGTGGIGLFKQKTGTTLEFKKLNTNSNKISLTDATINDEIDIDLNEANIVINNLSGAPIGNVIGNSDTQTLTNKTINTSNNTLILDTADIITGTFNDIRIAVSNVTQYETSINHDNLTGFIINEHIDHSTVIIDAGIGLTGGGDITATRTLDLSINNLVIDPAPDSSADYILSYDTSANAHRRILIDNLPNNGNNGVATGGNQTVVQARRTTSFTSTSGTWTTVTFDITDLETSSNILDHDSGNTGKIIFKEDGPYLIYYHAVCEFDTNDVVSARVVLNDTSEISGSYQKVGTKTNNSFGDLDNVFVTVANKNDYITLQVINDSGNFNSQANFIFGAVRLSGARGMDWQGQWVNLTAYSETMATYHNGDSYYCKMAHTSSATDEPGVGASWTTYWDTITDAAAHVHDTSVITSGTFDDARIGVTNVTQHEASININNLLNSPTSAVVGATDTQTLSNKILTLPQINDLTADHQYVFDVSELVADRTVTLPLLIGNDTFIFANHAENLTNKTINTSNNTLILDTADITTGTFDNSRIASSNITQHEGSIDHDNLLGFVLNEHLDWTIDQTINNIHDNNIVSSNVTQHEASININNLLNSPSSTVIGATDTQSLTNKTLTLPIISTISNTGIITLPTSTDTLIGRNTADTLTNKTLTNPIITTISNTGTITLPISTDTLIGRDTTDILTNKTLTNPIITTISNTGTITLPTSTDTLVGRNTTDTLTNKTLGDNLNMNSNKIINLSTPTTDTDGATKAYVDSVATGLDVKESVVTATTQDLDSNSSISNSITYNSTGGTSGRGQITATLATADIFTVDNINFGTAQNNSRILLKDQITGSQNGIWITTISGTSLTLDRATGFDTDDKVTGGAFMFVEQGTVNADTGWTLTTNDPIIIGGALGTSLSFSQFSGAGNITAGTGLTKTGNTLDVIGSNTIIANADSMEVNSSNTANQVLLSSGTAGIASTFGQLPLNNTDSIIGTLSVENGGTGQTTLTSGNILRGNGANGITSNLLAPIGIIVGTTDTQTLSNKILTLPQINDLSENHQYVLGVSELIEDRTVTLPLLISNDTFVFTNHAETLTNKTINTSNNTLILDTADITTGTFANSRISSSNITQHEGAINHDNLAGFVVNEHLDWTIDQTTNNIHDNNIITSNITQHEGSININNLLNSPSSVIVGITDTQTLTNKTLTLPQINDTSSDHQYIFGVSELIADRTISLPLLTDNDTFVFANHVETLTNKIINADNNTLTNIDNTNIKSNALIDTTKIADGTVTNTEFQYLNSITSNVQTQLDDKIPFTETNLLSINNGNPGDLNHIQFKVTKGTLPDTYNLGIDTSNPCKVIWSTEDGTRRQATVLASDASATATVFGTSVSNDSGISWEPVLVARQDKRVGINTNAPSDTLDVIGNIVVSGTVDGRDIATDGSTLDSHVGATSAHGISGNIVGTTDTQTLSNKTLTLPQINDTSADHQYIFGVSDLIADRTVTLPLLIGNDTFVFADHVETLTNKTISTVSNTLILDTGDITTGTFANARISSSNITQHEGSINHDNLLGFVANEHLDWTIDQTTNNIHDNNILASSVTQHEVSININNLLNSPTSSTVGITDTQTLSNKTLTLPQINDLSTDHQYVFAVSELIADRTVTLPLLINNDTFVFANHTETLTNKIITTTSNTLIIDTTDITTGTFADARIAVSNVTQHEGSITIDNLVGAPTGTVVGTTDTQTLTNKTLTTPIISSISNTGTVTLPTSTDTLVGRSTTDTLTNKTWGDNLNLNSNKIVNLSPPTVDTDGATKAYVDSVATGLDIKDSVLTASTVDLDSNTSISGTISYNSTSGISGRGQITATLVTTDTLTIDGVNIGSAQNNSRILLKDQSTSSQNGIWTITISGTSLILDRSTDFDGNVDVTSGAFMFIEQGTINADSGWTLTTNDPIIIGGASGTSLSFSQFSGAGQITAGTGMTKTGNTLNVDGSTTIISNADNLEVNSSATANQILLSSGTAGTASTFGALPLDNSNAVTGTLLVANGGTGQTTLTSGKILQGNGTSGITSNLAAPSGDIVGTTDTQTLSNKTIDTSNNTLVLATGDITSGTLPVVRGGSGTSSLTQDGILKGNGTGAITSIKSKWDGTNAPTTTDDTILGYEVGSRWIDTTNDKEYVCLDATATIAVWSETTLTTSDMNATQTRRVSTYTCTASYVDITFDATDVENDTSVVEHDNVNTERITVKETGLYSISAVCNFDALTMSEPYARIYKNGTTIIGTEYSNSSATGNSFPFINISTIASLTANDYVTLQVKDIGTDKATLRTGATLTLVRMTGAKGNPGGGSGETNTASNIGTSGIGVFKQKTGLDLEFRKINSGSSKITIVQDDTNNEIDIDLIESNLTLDNIGGTLSVINGGIGTTSLTQDSWLIGNGTGAITAIKNNMNASVAPSTSTDDTTLGYAIGSRWFDTTADKEYVCLDATDGTAVWIETTSVGGSGETNTASNVGSGTDIFKQKAGVNLEFRGINAASNKISAIVNVDNIDIDIVSGNITIGDLSGAPTGTVVGTTDTQTLSNKTLTLPQINDTSLDHQYLFAVSELTLDRTITLPLLTGNDTFVFANHTETLTNKTIDADNNTITNIDNADIKAGASINASKIHDGTITNTEFGYLNGVTSAIQTQFTGKVNTSTVFTAGIGLAGGGDLTTNRTIDLDINSLTADAIPDGGVDYVVTYDASSTGYKKVLLNDLPTGAGGEINAGSNIGTGGIGIYKQKTGTTLEFKKINSTSATSGIAIVDDTGNNEVDVRLDINSLTTDATPDGAADYIVTYDSSATSYKKVLLDNLPSSSVNYLECVEVSSISTTSSTYQVMNGMTCTPTSGTWHVMFSTTSRVDAKDVYAYFAIHKAGTIIDHSVRSTHNVSGHTHNVDVGIHTQAVVSVNGSEIIDIRFRNNNNVTATNVDQRSLFLYKLASV